MSRQHRSRLRRRLSGTGTILQHTCRDISFAIGLTILYFHSPYPASSLFVALYTPHVFPMLCDVASMLVFHLCHWPLVAGPLSRAGIATVICKYHQTTVIITIAIPDCEPAIDTASWWTLLSPKSPSIQRPTAADKGELEITHPRLR